MKSLTSKLRTILSLPFLPFKRTYYWKKAIKSNLPGKSFAQYGFDCGRKLFFKGRISPKLLFNPVSIVRYFEFDYTHSNLNDIEGSNILDVSSPYLLGFFLCKNYNYEYTYINPDNKDLNNVNSLANKLNFKGKYSTESKDARSLPYPDHHFDTIISISVLEHISNNGDSDVMREMWRVLKRNGKLIITFPVKKQYDEEYRDSDTYNLESKRSGGKYFFQRMYDESKINERLLSSIDNFEIINKKIFGESLPHFYEGYKERWIRNGYWETVKDPYYITKYFKYFDSISELYNIGIMGLTIKKVK